jgi:hypothetical protein
VGFSVGEGEGWTDGTDEGAAVGTEDGCCKEEERERVNGCSQKNQTTRIKL